MAVTCFAIDPLHAANTRLFIKSRQSPERMINTEPMYMFKQAARCLLNTFEYLSLTYADIEAPEQPPTSTQSDNKAILSTISEHCRSGTTLSAYSSYTSCLL